MNSLHYTPDGIEAEYILFGGYSMTSCACINGSTQNEDRGARIEKVFLLVDPWNSHDFIVPIVLPPPTNGLECSLENRLQ